MSKIDTTNWQGFMIIDLFTVVNTHSILKTSIKENSGIIPYVTASNENNGVFSYINYDRNQMGKGNAIMMGGKTLTVTYQKQDFFSNDSHNLALYLKNEIFRTEKIQLFLVSALKASFGNTYNWGDSISNKSISGSFGRFTTGSAISSAYSCCSTGNSFSSGSISAVSTGLFSKSAGSILLLTSLYF